VNRSFTSISCLLCVPGQRYRRIYIHCQLLEFCTSPGDRPDESGFVSRQIQKCMCGGKGEDYVQEYQLKICVKICRATLREFALLARTYV
jgi:hypothetical protein